MTSARPRPDAYSAGVADVVALARQCAARLEAGTKRPLAVGFGIEALRALADEAEQLVRKPDPKAPAS